MEHNYTMITALIVGCLLLAIGYYFGYNAGYMQSLEDDMNRRIDEDDLHDLDIRIENAIKETRSHE